MILFKIKYITANLHKIIELKKPKALFLIKKDNRLQNAALNHP